MVSEKISKTLLNSTLTIDLLEVLEGILNWQLLHFAALLEQQ